MGTQTPNRTLHVTGAGGDTPAANEIYLENPDGKSCQLSLVSEVLETWSIRNAGGDAGDALQLLQGGNIYVHTTKTGDVLIGGVLPDAPAIALKNDGGAYFSSNIGIDTDAPVANLEIGHGVEGVPGLYLSKAKINSNDCI